VGRRTKKRSFQPRMTTYARLLSMPLKQRGEGGGGEGGEGGSTWTRIFSPEPMGSPPLGMADMGGGGGGLARRRTKENYIK
jgi:hypothetical protein